MKKIIELMNSASFLVIPSIWYEGFPMVILELILQGFCFRFRIGSVGEVVIDKVTGLQYKQMIKLIFRKS